MAATERFGQLATVIAVGCALTMTVIAVRREFYPDLGAGSRPNGATAKPVAVANWAQFAIGGHRMGSIKAPVTIVEFGDFECPACGRFEKTLRAIRAEFPTQVAVVFRHWPLPYHRFAYLSARAAECAADQGRFDAMHDILYSKQDSLGIKSFGAFAQEAGVPDSGAFATCNARTGLIATIVADTAAVKRVGGTGTPTIIVNGLRLVAIPDSASLEHVVRDALKKAS